jgi:hypothetical protein
MVLSLSMSLLLLLVHGRLQSRDCTSRDCTSSCRSSAKHIKGSGPFRVNLLTSLKISNNDPQYHMPTSAVPVDLVRNGHNRGSLSGHIVSGPTV